MFDLIIQLNKFNNVVFNETDHSYYIKGKRCISTTELIGRYKKPFEKNILASKVALRDGKTKDEVLNEWEEIKFTSQVKGTEIHKCAELMWQNKGYELFNTYGNCYNNLVKFYSDYKDKLALIRAELVVGDDEYGVCGMLDKLFYNIEEDELQIWDYKTSKEIGRKSKYRAKLINGLNHLEECEYNVYSLQLSVYKKIIEKNTNLKIGKSYICWINEEEDNYEVIETKFFDKETSLMLENRVDEYNFSLFE